MRPLLSRPHPRPHPRPHRPSQANPIRQTKPRSASLFGLLLSIAAGLCVLPAATAQTDETQAGASSTAAETSTRPKPRATAIFAGGCFWCMEADFERQEGVTQVISGFAGGTLKNPTYSGNHEGHFEAIEVTYDPTVVSYKTLLQLFWHSIDPLDGEGQFCDKGFSYRSAVFPANPAERALVDLTLQKVEKHFAPQTIHTEVREAGAFWPVEEYHQNYYLKNPLRYKYYRWNCGRDQRLKAVWGDAAKKATP